MKLLQTLSLYLQCFWTRMTGKIDLPEEYYLQILEESYGLHPQVDGSYTQEDLDAARKRYLHDPHRENKAVAFMAAQADENGILILPSGFTLRFPLDK